jgi:serine/threonine protein kinase
VDEKLKQEYLDELLIMSKLSHSNIVSFLGASMDPPNLCMVMELCEDSLYSQLHKKRYNFSEYDIIRIATDIAYAMEYLHSQKPCIIHRDLKSHNVLISYEGVAKVCDFGLVKNTCITAGTPAYMAPELFENKQYNRSVDSYAFAILLWELFTGEVPFYCMEIADIRNRVIDGGRPIIPSTIPRRSADLIRTCW